jgi:hypothetical protein
MTLAAVLLLLQATATTAGPPLPFSVGERLEYQGRFGILRVGTATLSVEGVESFRDAPHWKFSFTSRVSVPLYKSESEMASWTGVGDFISRRFTKTIEENGRRRAEEFRIFPDSGFYRRNVEVQTVPTSTRPLDDVAFFYWIRTVPLVVGETYQFANYYRNDRNPVTVEVLKREMMEMPDGTKVPCLVLHPVVDEPNGMFSRRSEARLWLTDDARRIPVQIQSTYAFGEVRLVLKKVTPGSGTP